MYPNFVIHGTPHIQETQVSRFSATDYLQFPFLVDFAGRPWQLDFSFTTSNNVTAQQNILDSAFGLAFAVANGKIEIALSSDGVSWNLGAHFGTKAILPATTYLVRMTFNGSKYTVQVSDDAATYTTDIEVASTASLAPKQMIIGKSVDNSHVFTGSLNLAMARLSIANVLTWEGMAEIGANTRLATDLSNIDQAGIDRINEIAGERLPLTEHNGMLCITFEQQVD